MSITPLDLITNDSRHRLPREICDIIQSYMVNDTAYQILKEYYNYLYYKKQLYLDFVYSNYIEPNCYCHRTRRGWYECTHCWEFEYTDKYCPLDCKICIDDNPQYTKICFNMKTPHSDYDEDKSCSYDYHFEGHYVNNYNNYID